MASSKVNVKARVRTMITSANAVAYSTSLGGFFGPKAVAVVGASERPESVGRTLLWNLLTNPFGGVVFPVNPKRHSVLGVKAYESIGSIGQDIDLAVVATAASAVPGVMEECGRAGIKSMILMSSFREAGRAGAGFEAEALAIARKNQLRVIGPYSLGVMVPRTGFNATVTSGRARPGRVGVVSQSGTMCSAILDWSEKANVGFSAFVSIGNMMDVNWGDLIYYLGDDPETRCILLYMETIGDPKAFLSAAREVANLKPIVVLKGGRAEAAARTTAASTGCLVASDEVLDAALNRSGVLRVNTIEDLFQIAEVLGKQPLPKGRRLAIVTNAGGPAVLAIDSLTAEGGRLAELSEETVKNLSQVLPDHWSRGNPIVGLGDGLKDSYPKTIQTLAKDAGVDGILVVLTPKPTVDAALVAERVKGAAQGIKVPLLASWMGGEAVSVGRKVLRDAGIPTFPFPDAATRIFNYMWKYKENLNSLYETPHPIEEWEFHQGEWVRDTLSELIARAREERRVLLTDIESKKVLEAYGIPVLRAVRATGREEAAERAREIGFPVALEALLRLPQTGPQSRFSVLSEMFDYREHSNLSWANLNTPDDVLHAYGLIERDVQTKVGQEAFAGVSVKAMPESQHCSLLLGSDVDPQFGPVIYFGSGGWLGGVHEDYAIGLPPFNTNLARKLMEQTQIFRALVEMGRVTPAVAAQLATVLMRFGQLIIDQPVIREIRIDPLILSAKGVHAADVHLVLLDASSHPRVKPAIRPYPSEYIRKIAAADGSTITFRPIRPEDEPRMSSFHERLSDQTVYNRYFSSMHVDQRTRHESLSRDCFSDYDRNIIIVVEDGTEKSDIIGVGRLIRIRGTNDAEFAVMIEDRLQGQGLGKALLAHLVAIAGNEGMTRLIGYVLEANTGMTHLCEQLGFAVRRRMGQDTVEAVLSLASRADRGSARPAGR
jgi:acetyltransferase